jgi:hypothetical protein
LIPGGLLRLRRIGEKLREDARSPAMIKIISGTMRKNREALIKLPRPATTILDKA